MDNINSTVPNNNVQGLNDVAGTNTQVNPQQTTQADVNAFYDALPEHLKQYKALNKFDSVDKLADAYVNASKLIGKRIQDVKPDELKGILHAEDIAEVYKHIGVPTSADEYELPEGIDADIAKVVKDKAYELGIPKDKLGQLLSIEQEVNKMAQSRLQENWRTDVFNKYGKDFEPAIKMAQNAVKEFGGQDLQNYLNQTGLGDHPAMVDMFVKIGSLMKEDRIPNTQSTERGQTIGNIQQEINRLRNDSNFMQQWRNGNKQNGAVIEDLYRRLSLAEKG